MPAPTTLATPSRVRLNAPSAPESSRLRSCAAVARIASRLPRSAPPGLMRGNPASVRGGDPLALARARLGLGRGAALQLLGPRIPLRRPDQLRRLLD